MDDLKQNMKFENHNHTIRGTYENNLLNELFFSQTNIELLQKKLINKVLKKYKYCKVTFSVIIILFAMYSIIGTYNYLEWNKVRWSLGESLVSKGILVENIENAYRFFHFF